MKYLVIDAALHGTGIRDYYEGGYIDPEALSIAPDLLDRLNKWLLKYEEEHYNGFINSEVVNKLDLEGREIAQLIKRDLKEVKMDYYSAAKLIKEPIA